jgi:two-component system phosphate regulon sensor histidine kinase PhoR
VSLALTASAERIRLSVTDRGIGIPPEHLPRLFDRFYRVDAARRRVEGGAGLGLAIVKTLVEAQGGIVSVQSEIGIGSTFTVELPRAAALP